MRKPAAPVVGTARGFWRRLRELLPSAADYRSVRHTWRADLLAGVTVGIVALPLALGFGVASGLSAEAGLITAIVAGVIAAVFGGSHVQVSGPTGAMVVVLLPIVATHGTGAVTTIALLAGVIVVLAGLLRMGRAITVIPWPVIEGFTLGIAVIIFCQQVPLLTSAEHAPPGEHSTNAVVAAIEALRHADPVYLMWSLAVVVVVAGVMVIAPRIHRTLPGSLIGIILATVALLFISTPLARIGDLPAGIPAPTLPELDGEALPALLVPAATVAALAAIESLLSARVAMALADTGPFDPDRELIGQGLASFGASFFGGMPATGAIARTAVNVRSGGRTRLSAIIHAVVLLTIVLVVAGPVGAIPLAALAGVLMLTAWRMIPVREISTLMRSTPADAAAFVVTAVVTVSVDLIVAIIIGVLVAGVFAVRTLSRHSAIHREPITAEPVSGDERIAILRLEGPLIFTSAERILEGAQTVVGADVVILRLSRLDHIDATGARMLSDIVQVFERKGTTVLIKGVRHDQRNLLNTLGVIGALRHPAHLFVDLDAAIAHARSHVVRGRG